VQRIERADADGRLFDAEDLVDYRVAG